MMQGLRLFGVGALVALGTACASSGAVPKPFPMPRSAGVGADASPSSAFFSAVVSTALELRGVPYKNGGSDRSGFDCSGFTQFVFARHGVALPREVREQFMVGTPIDPTGDLQPGDLLFFTTTESGASHVAISVGGEDFVHAPSSTGVVRVERLTTAYWTERFLGARRLAAP